MGLRYLACLSLVACSLAALPAMALTFQTPLEAVQWKVEGDVFECRLSQPIANFGEGQFVRRAGEKPVFRLTAPGAALGTGSANLYAAAAPWQPGRADVSLGAVRLGAGPVVMISSQGQASGLLGGLLEGRSSVVRTVSSETGRGLEVRVLPINFNKAWAEYQACAARLLPMNYDQARLSQIPFPGAGMDLSSAAKARLDALLAFMKADPTVNHIELDGHSDNSGNRLTNRELSRRRALAVADYLKARGVPENQIEVRFHGEQYPVVPNTSAANRARNRRVNVELDRRPGSPAPEAQQVTSEPSASAASTAAPGPAPAATPPSAPVAAPAASPTPGKKEG
ncbi:flagellar protein MotY [Pseudomonas massiliensis]|uniref:flagellar protein MotY n=1 Tax=Pseudomonas massiliensis TaxID=522492 RepID=UPI00058D0D94|nr:OmpA family protein [Pseudomonas massiliensis]